MTPPVLTSGQARGLAASRSESLTRAALDTAGLEVSEAQFVLLDQAVEDGLTDLLEGLRVPVVEGGGDGE